MSDKHWAAFSANTRQFGSLTVSYDNLFGAGLVEEHLGLIVKKIIDAVGVRITDLEAENHELREKYDGAVKECQRLTDLLAMRGD